MIGSLVRPAAGALRSARKAGAGEIFDRLSSLPGGTRLFTGAVCLKAPYFAGIRPHVVALRPGHCEVRIRDRRGVHNHLGTVHAIAMCNMAELAGGLMTDVSIPAGHRWIPRGMSVEYLAKARGDLRAVASMEERPSFEEPCDLPVEVAVLDHAETTVMRARITMRVSPRPA
jgi:acyl-coenzyme A thioesterase PaaI-like protein